MSKNTIKFTDEKGCDFFQCSQAEARIAITAIEDKRQNVDQKQAEADNEKRIIDGILKRSPDAKTCSIDFAKTDKDRSFKCNDLIDMLAEIQKKEAFVNYIFLSVNNYRDLLKDIMGNIHLEIDHRKIMIGVMGEVFGSTLVVLPTFPDNITTMVSNEGAEDGKEIIVNYRMGYKYKAEESKPVQYIISSPNASPQDLKQIRDEWDKSIADPNYTMVLPFSIEVQTIRR